MSLWSVGINQYLDKWLYRRFIFLLLAAYVLAGLIPSPGLWLQKVEWGSLPGTHRNVTSSLIMLGALLFNAGFSVTSEHVSAFRRRPSLSLAGLMGKALIAITWISILMIGLSIGLSSLWISMLAGFAIVSMMPAATSSAAWAQQTNSNMALSLGLLLLSTCMMPVMFPMMSWLSQQLPPELRAQDFTGTKSVNSLSFIMIWIIAPVIGGRVFRWFSGVKGTTQWTTSMKWTNALNLLLLNYMNGASFLPQCVQSFHSSAVFSLLLGVLTCCSMGFLTGIWIGKILKVTTSETMALMFGTGMNNNGMALVLATQFLGASGWIGMTIALCTFGQHLVAAAIQIMWSKPVMDIPFSSNHAKLKSKIPLIRSSDEAVHRHESSSTLLSSNPSSHQSTP